MSYYDEPYREVQIRSECQKCNFNGEVYQENDDGIKVFVKCPTCKGKKTIKEWVSLKDLKHWL